MELFAHAWALLHGGSTDEPTLREALEAAEQGLERAAAWPQYGSGPHLHLAKAIAQYKLAKMRQQDLGPAIETLRGGLSQHEFIPLRPRHKHVPMSRHELETQLAEYLVEQGNTDEAEQVYREGVEVRIKRFGDEHPQVALAELRFGAFLFEQGKYDLAESPLQNAYANLKDNPQAADANRERAATLMVDLYNAWNRTQDAAEWQSKVDAARQPDDKNEAS
jgi:tetratricopeptide (TPR) repeat protein